MSMIDCELSLEQLVELAIAKGLSTNDVLEAKFYNIIQVCRRSEVVAVATNKISYFYSPQASEDMQDVVLTAEKFIAELPAVLNDVAELMESSGGLNPDRAIMNWSILEAIMADNDPEVRRYLEERDGKSAGIITH